MTMAAHTREALRRTFSPVVARPLFFPGRCTATPASPEPAEKVPFQHSRPPGGRKADSLDFGADSVQYRAAELN